MPDPNPTDCDGVCQRFLLFAVGRSLSWFNQGNKNLKSRQYELDAADRVHQQAYVQKIEHERLTVKTRHVVNWLQQQRKEHLIMPNEAATVLPYQDN